MTINEAIERADALLPGTPAPDDAIDPRWQAIIEVGAFIETHPEEVWSFVDRWGGHEQDDLRAAIATCLLEHLLEHDFERFFARVEGRARKDERFGEMLCMCAKFGQSRLPANAKRLDRLIAALSGPMSGER